MLNTDTALWLTVLGYKAHNLSKTDEAGYINEEPSLGVSCCPHLLGHPLHQFPGSIAEKMEKMTLVRSSLVHEHPY